MTTVADNQLLAMEVKGIRARLRDAGWRVANAVGELKDPDGVKWFTSVYTHGEYTVEASYRYGGAGPSKGKIRVRLTPELIRHHPNVADRLARDLIVARVSPDPFETEWPPAAWAEHSL